MLSPRAAILFLVATFFITVMSALVHYVTQEVPIGQVIFWRSFASLPVIVAYMWARGQLPAALHTNHPKLHIIRGLLGAGAMACSFISLAYLPVANAKALSYLGPVFTLPLAALIGGETVTRRIIIATSLGMGGVIAMLWQALALPGNSALIGVAAGLSMACITSYIRIHIRRMTRTERPATIALSFAVTATFVGLCTWPFGWEPLSGTYLMLLVMVGTLGGMAHVLSAEAVKIAPVSLLAPLEYSGLVWALGIDLIIFRNNPGLWGFLGAVMILGGALLVTLGMRRQRTGVPTGGA
ncbi:DMT family transporter [Paracoccaceae bacterium GXU_MW_L88]